MLVDSHIFNPRVLHMSVLVTPNMANFSGHMHGGELLNFLDKVAYACALRYTGRYVVTLSVDKVLFKQPIFIGEMITFLAMVNYTGKTSLEVGIKVISEDLKKKTQRHTNSCYFTMVALDDNRKPCPVPPFEPQTADEKKRFAEAAERRQKSLGN
jgi:acyl-CoA hydrolase